MSVRNRFSERVRVGVDCSVAGNVSRTKQSMRDQCDINNIMRRFVKVGAVAHLNRFPGTYGEAPAVTFHEAMNVVRAAEEAFEALPGKLRKRFGNDPGQYMAFCGDPQNLPEMRKMGLAQPELVKEPSIAEQVVEGVKAATAAAGGAQSST